MNEEYPLDESKLSREQKNKLTLLIQALVQTSEAAGAENEAHGRARFHQSKAYNELTKFIMFEL